MNPRLSCIRLESTTSDSSTQSQKFIAKRTSQREIQQADDSSLSELVLKEMDLSRAEAPQTESSGKSVGASKVDLMNLRPVLKSAGNIAAYIRDSHTLSKLVELGVDLSKIESNAKATDLLVKLDFEDNVKPYLLFLHGIGVPDSLLAHCITKNPLIFAESLEDLQLRVDYLKAKKFDANGIVSLVTRAPQFLSLSTKELDGKLGYLQKKFSLSGPEVRAVVVKQPRLLRTTMESVRWHVEILDFVGYDKDQIKRMFLAHPKMFLIGTRTLLSRHEYLHNVMLLPLERLLDWPQIYNTRESKLEQRHLFLTHRNRAQYDPTKENFVSLYRLVSTDDATFATEVAMATVMDYNQFLKTM